MGKIDLAELERRGKEALLEIADLRRAERARGRGAAGARQAGEAGAAEAYTVSESASG